MLADQLYKHHHPNIVPIYDMCFHAIRGEGVWKLSLFMHYADRGSLDQLAMSYRAQESRMPLLLLTVRR